MSLDFYLKATRRFVNFVRAVLDACVADPDAEIEVSR